MLQIEKGDTVESDNNNKNTNRKLPFDECLTYFSLDFGESSNNVINHIFLKYILFI